MVLAQGSDQGSDKRPRHSGRFSGASSGGRDSFGEAILLGHFSQHFRLLKFPYSAPPAPISAPPLQSFQGGYPGRQGQFQARREAEASDAVITGTVSVCSRDVSVLFDPGSTYFYVSSYFAPYLVVPHDSLSAPVYVSTPVSDSMVVDHVYRACMVIIGGLETHVDLLLPDMVDFDVILGMDWLSPYHTILDCYAKTVTLELPGLPRLE
ncbi:uncharacterized protein [Nicotiana sylvestris]|uniref:uncharacterized protein n=1 Tax=Nicotiana sylvestris TaxID=4096 RepID=UPI00388C41EB